jgi:predicted DNA-binding antitoxin AbrB/MazE fold protein
MVLDSRSNPLRTEQCRSARQRLLLSLNTRPTRTQSRAVIRFAALALLLLFASTGIAAICIHGTGADYRALIMANPKSIWSGRGDLNARPQRPRRGGGVLSPSYNSLYYYELRPDYLRFKSSSVVDSVAVDFLTEQQAPFRIQSRHGCSSRCRVRNGVLRPLQPLDLKEHEHIVVSVVKAEGESKGPRLAVEYIERLKTELGDDPIPSLEEVRKRLSKIPGSMADEIISQRGER